MEAGPEKRGAASHDDISLPNNVLSCDIEIDYPPCPQLRSKYVAKSLMALLFLRSVAGKTQGETLQP